VARDVLDPDPVRLTQLRNRAICRYTAWNIWRRRYRAVLKSPTSP